MINSRRETNGSRQTLLVHSVESFAAGRWLGRLQLSGNPEKDLEEFLVPLPAWMRRTLQEGFPSLTQTEILEWTNNFDEVFRLTSEYEQILQRIPLRWRAYRERLKRQARRTAQWEIQYLVPKGRSGAPRKDELAQEAALLQQRGMNFPQIAEALNKQLGEDRKTTADAIRKLLKRRSEADKN